MIKDLSPGVVVVAKGKVAIVKQVFSEKSIKVQLTSTGESLIVSFSDMGSTPFPRTVIKRL
ncbi:hypothetical protein [uncultured Halopseudomonas sp.]|uniref:hypothetical protein n=1 Tax=uncultured Halopseudomonas sp. TaxID=2901193 RepID=UPI0030ECFD1D|tara:strand:+ start:67320 stop:67502 length:183 start_codon:yes stop_codon:yes gene_type:complete